MKKPVTPKRRRIRKVCIILIVSTLSYVVVSMAGSVIIFQIIFSRSGSIAPYELTYDDIDQDRYPREELWFPSGNQQLFGCLYQPKEKSSGIILLANGMNCCIDRHLPEILWFVDNGFSVFTFEYTGVGHSQGNGTVGIAQARLDVRSAIAYIRSRSDLCWLPLLLYGHSLGGYAVGTALQDDDSIRAAVCVAGFNEPNENMLHHARRYVGFLADLQYPFMCLQNYFLFGNDSNETVIAAVNSVRTPVLIIGGNTDDIVTEDISILHKKDEITNPNAVTLLIEAPYRGGHNTLWLREDAARYLAKTDNPTDKHQANILDENYMNQVLSFYRHAIA